jgi:hypothetical protein
VALIFIIGIFLFLKSKHVPLLTTSRIGNQILGACYFFMFINNWNFCCPK